MKKQRHLKFNLFKETGMPPNTALVLLVLSVIFTIVLVSCGKRSTTVATSPPASPTSTTIPTFSQLDQLPSRSPSATNKVKGADAILTSPTVKKLTDTDSIQMNAEKTFSWAIYKLGKYEAGNYIVNGKLEWLLLNPFNDDQFNKNLKVWIGVSNYKTNSWQWIRYYPEAQAGIDFSQIRDASINPKTGNAYLIVAIQGLDLELVSIDLTTKKEVTEVWQDTLAVDRVYIEPNNYKIREKLALGKCQDKPMITFQQLPEEPNSALTDLFFGIAKKTLPTEQYDWNIMYLAKGKEDLDTHSRVLTEINGKPALCFSFKNYDFRPGRFIPFDDLIYCYSTKETPTSQSDWVFCSIDNYDYYYGSFDSLMEVEHKPVFLASRADNENLTLPIVINIGKTSTPKSTEDWDWFDLPIIDKDTTKDMCVVNGKLAIAYQNFGEPLTFMQFNSALPAKDDFTTHIIDPASSNQDYAGIDMEVINNKPVICFALFKYPSECKLRFAQALTSEPKSDSDWKITDVEVSINLAKLPRLSIVGNKPIIAYSKVNSLKTPDYYFATSTVEQPLSASDWQITKAFQDVAYDVNLTVINDLPFTIYNNNGQIYLAHRWIP